MKKPGLRLRKEMPKWKTILILKDIKEAIQLIESTEKHKQIKVCADCYSLENVWVNDHSKCSGNWYELDIFTGRIIKVGLGKKVIKKLFRKF